MSRRERKTRRHEQPAQEPFARYEKEVKPLRPLTKSQQSYLHSIINNTITFAIGPAGTGKTYVAGGYAAQLLKDGEIDKIYITRPAVEAGESFGFLPGELTEKYAPFIEPLRDTFNERLGRSFTDYCISHGKIIASPLAFMRGKSFKDSFIILDEAQNTSTTQMKMFLTRIGENCKVVVDGDVEQKDILGTSGLQDAVCRLSGIPSVGVVRFSLDDIVRSGIVRHIVRAYAT